MLRLPVRFRTLLALVTVMAVVLGACGGDDDDSAGAGAGAGTTRGSKTIKVGMITPLTGRVASAGTGQLAGVRVAVDEINETGYLGKGVTVELLVENTEGDPATAVAAAQKLMAKGVVGFIGGTLTPTVGAVKPRVIEAKVPLVITSSLQPDMPQPPYVYRAMPLPASKGGPNAQIAKAVAADGIKTAAIMVTSDNDGQKADGEVWKRELEAAGVKVVGVVSVNSQETNLAGPATQIVDMKPDMVVNTMVAGGQAAAGVKAVVDRGYKGLIVAYQSLSTPEDYKVAGKTLDGVVIATVYSPASDWPATKNLYDRVQAAHNRPPSILDAQGYAAMMLLAQGIRDADDPTSSESIATALSKITKVDSVFGAVRLGDDGSVYLEGDLPFLVWRADGTQSPWREPDQAKS